MLENFGKKSSTLKNDNSFKKLVERLKDSILAIKYLPAEHKNPIEELSNILRDLNLVELINTNDTFPGSGSALKKARRQVIKLPSTADYKSILAISETERKKLELAAREKIEKKKKQIKSKIEMFFALRTAISEIMKIDNSNLASTIQKPKEGFLLSKNFRPLQIFQNQIEQQSTLGQLMILNAKTSVERIVTNQEINSITNQESVAPTGTTKRVYHAGSAPFTPLANAESQFRFKSGTENLLSKESLNILKDRNLSITEMSIDKVVANLRFESETLSEELEILTQTQESKSIKRIGNTMVCLLYTSPSPRDS